MSSITCSFGFTSSCCACTSPTKSIRFLYLLALNIRSSNFGFRGINAAVSSTVRNVAFDNASASLIFVHNNICSNVFNVLNK